MSRHYIIATCAAALLSGVAQADFTIPFAYPEFGACQEPAPRVLSGKAPLCVYPAATSVKGTYSGNVGIDYSSKYTNRGMALHDSTTDHSLLFSLAGQYNFTEKDSVVVGGSFNWLADKGFDHYAGHGLCDELSGVIEYAHRFSCRTVLAAGYQFVHGGLPGRTNYHGDGDPQFLFFDSDRPEEHSLVLDFHHEFDKKLKGFFWDSRVQYSFRWVEGFWFANTFGYKYELNEKTDIVVSATWNASMNYYDAHTANSNGTQGYSINVSAPTMVTENIRVTPHAGMYFIGNGAEHANNAAGADIYRDVTFVVGVGASYVF